MLQIFKLTFTCFFFFISSLWWASAQQITINEIMSSNATTIADEDGDFEDWIELYNYGDEEINLEGWGISDDYNNPFRWIFHDVAIGAGEYLLVWASGKDRTGIHLHTNFSISSQGEEIILVAPDGNWVAEVPPVHIPTDVSYGRYPNGAGTFRYFTQPTPAQPNNDNGYSELLYPPVFSHAPGFYTDSFFLKVVHHDPAVMLHYTLDGSVPDLSSSVFPDSLLIYDRENDPDEISSIPTTGATVPEWYRWYPPMDLVFKGTNIRVRAFKEGALNPYTETRTWWVDPDIHSRYSLPILSLSINQNDLFGPQGIYTNFNQTGPNWERDMHIAFFEPDGSLGFATDAGVRTHGGNSRRYALKSFRVYFRNVYGVSILEYPLFLNQQMNRHDRLILRNAGSDWAFTYYRDAFIQSILHGFSAVETQAYQPAVVFLNSEYWGILNIRERFDDNYIKNHYGYTEIDMLDNTGQANYGSNTHYVNLISFLHNNSLDVQENYEWVKTQMDVDDFMDYHILQVFAMNTDQPGKNVRFWRPRTPDGRWRWMWWDMDDSFHFGPHNPADRNGIVYCTGLDSIDAPSVNPATPPPAWAPNGPVQTFPLRALLGSPEFRQNFIIRFSDLLNTAFKPHQLNEVIDSFHDRVGPYLYEHYRRWHRPEPEVYNMHVNRLRDFSNQRADHVNQQLTDFFHLEGSYDLSMDVSGNGHLRVNSITLQPELPSLTDPVYPWSGTYFKNIPLEVEAIPAPGSYFSHWDGDIFSEDPIIYIEPDTDLNLTAHFSKPEEREIITFWYFNVALPNNLPLEEITPWYSANPSSLLTFSSAFEGYPYHEDHDLWRKASMERRNQPTIINYRPKVVNFLPYDPENMRGIQIKQPFRNDQLENTIVFSLPTKGFEDIVFSFAAIDEGAAEVMIIDYAVEEKNDLWITEGITTSVLPLEDQYDLYRIVFDEVPGSDDNDHFRIRLRFDGDDMLADEGQRITINNIALEGNPLIPVYADHEQQDRQLMVFPNPAAGDVVYLPEEMDIVMFNAEGRMVLYASGTNQIAIQDLSPGIYIIVNQNGETTRLIRQ